jgi:hypothetical protein
MEQTPFTPSSAASAPNDPPVDIGWKLGMLREIAEMGMDMAREVHSQAAAEPAPEQPAKTKGDPDVLARAFARLTRGVRLTIALHTKLEEDHRRQSEEGAAERERRAAEAREKRRAYQLARARRAVEATLDAKAGKNWQERDRLEEELRERLLDFDDYALCGQRSVGEIIARICRDLGVTPDWTRWVDADWAREEMATKPAGSPYANWPPVRPAPARKPASGARPAAAATGPP